MKKTIFFGFLIISFVLYASWINKDIFLMSVRDKVLHDFTQNSRSTELKTIPSRNTVYTFAVISDIHNNTTGLSKAVQKINNSKFKFTVGLGDYTNVGTTQELQLIKQQLENLKQPFYALPGDHDLWNGRDKSQNPYTFYKPVFGAPPANFQQSGIEFLFLDNADLYRGVDSQSEKQFYRQISDSQASTIVVFAHKPLWHKISKHTMGYINNDINQLVADQSQRLIEYLKKTDKKVYLIHGDLHSSESYLVPQSNITCYIVGALADLKNFQTPRFSSVEVTPENEIYVNDQPVD